MTREYTVNELVRLVIKKIWLVLTVGAVCAVVAVPTAESSYLAAKKAYDMYLTAAVEKDAAIEEQRIVQYGENCSFDIKIKTSSGEKYLAVGMVEILESYFQELWDDKYEGEDCPLTLVPVYSQNISKEISFNISIIGGVEYIPFIEEYITQIDKFLLRDYNGFFEVVHKTDNEDMVKLLMVEPVRNENYSKICVTSGLFGIFLAACLVLAVDFFAPVIKHEDELEKLGTITEAENFDICILSRMSALAKKKENMNIIRRAEKDGSGVIIKVALYKTPLLSLKKLLDECDCKNVSFIVKG